MSLPLSPLKDLAVDLFQVASTAPAAQTADKTNATRICGLSTQQRRTCIGRRQSEPSGLDSSTANTREPARAKETTSAGGRTVTNQRFKDTADNDDAPDARRRHRRQRGCRRQVEQEPKGVYSDVFERQQLRQVRSSSLTRPS